MSLADAAPDAAAPDDAAAAKPSPAGKVQVSCSPGFLEWLAAERVAVAFTTYQTNRLFLVGRDENGGLAAFERLLDRPMGLAASAERLWVATRFQLWRFDQVLAAGERHGPHDRLFVPRVGHVTGEVDVHDVHVAADGDVVFVNTLYSCLARLSEQHSFTPLWRPPWITALAPEDRCHLNGLAMAGGRPRFVTAVARSDTRQGWRDARVGGGVVVDVASGEVVATGLSMPHSPRLHDGRLYVFDSGRGDLCHVEPASGRVEPIAFCPGYLRGLACRGGTALAGLSKPREKTFRGLPLDARLADAGREARCGLVLVDLASGAVRDGLEVHGVVSELYDVAVLPETVRPTALGFKSDELRRTITFVDGERPTRHVLQRLEAGEAQAGGAPLPRARRAEPPTTTAVADAAPRRIAARTVELTLDQALARADLTFPDLRRTAAARPLREPLLATVLTAAPESSGAADGPPPALAAAVSVVRPAHRGAEVVSLVVRPELRGRGLGRALLAAVETELAARGVPTVDLAFRNTWASAPAVRALVAARGWATPRCEVVMAGVDHAFLEQPWTRPRPLPPGYEIFPWSELSADDRRDIVRRQQAGPWFPDSLSPFQLEERVAGDVSVGLRHQGRVVGWLVAHRVADEVIQYTSLFVEPGHGKLGRGLPLVAAAARRQAESGVPRGIFMVQADNAPMRRLLDRRLAPYVRERAELLRTGKRLRPDAAET